MDLSSAAFERVDAVFADMEVPEHPGAALLVIDHDERVYSKCYGFADLETQQPITADSSFYLASISKQFTAMAIMLLAERSKLSFDDRLLVYFPRFPAWGAEITLRHLLHHISGLPEYFHLFSSSERIPEFTRAIPASPTRPCSNESSACQDQIFLSAHSTPTATRAMCCWR